MLSKHFASIETYHSVDDYVFWLDLPALHYTTQTTQWFLEHHINSIPKLSKAPSVEDFWSMVADKVYDVG